MGKQLLLKIPTKTYLRKYITHHYRTPIKINYKSSLFSIVLIALLEKKVYRDLPTSDRNSRYDEFTDFVSVALPMSMLYHVGFNLSKDKAIVLNRFFEAKFTEELFFYCQRNVLQEKRVGGYNKAIEGFAKQFNIEIDVDITFDSLQKSEYRFRKKFETKSCGFVHSHGD